MRILIIDDDPMVLKSVSKFLSFQLNHAVTSCERVDEAIRQYEKHPFPLVISDIRMPGYSGFDLIQKLKALPTADQTEIILMTGFPDISDAVRAIRLGAYDFLRKPINIEELSAVLDRVEEHLRLKQENLELRQLTSDSGSSSPNSNARNLARRKAISEVAALYKIGIFSEEMEQLVNTALKYHTDRSIPVLIEGETGTGKEIIARLIHFGRVNPNQPFISLNCSSITESLFESELFGYERGAFTGADLKGRIGRMELAAGGTLFLDEIGEMPLSIQPKLLRAIQEREIYRVGGNRRIPLDIRIICATNRNLQQEVVKGNFRADLYYRINTASLYLPPLRDRKREIIPLAEHFLAETVADKNLRPRLLNSETEQLFCHYPWPGNVRQLKSALERAVFLSERSTLLPEDFAFLFEGEDLPASISASRNFCFEFPADGLDLYEMQERIARKALALHRGNKVKTAAYLNISVNKLRRILKEM